MKTAINKKIILLAISFALVLSLSVGTAFAYFSDYATAKGGATITLGGKTDIHETVVEDEKTISIENTGETDVVVRVKIFGPPTMTDEDNIEQYIDPGDGWHYKDDGFWYYDKILKPKDPESDSNPDSVTTDIVATIVAPEGQVENFGVVVVHESAQVTYGETGNILVPDKWYNVFN